ncbi:MAG: universal stress protein [Gemmatimonadaceae bacterium]
MQITELESGALPQRTHTGPLLIAGEDADHAIGVFHVAELLARRDRVNAHVLGVLRPLTIPAALLTSVPRDALEEGRRRLYLGSVRQRLHQATGRAVFFSVEIVTGNPASTLARAALERGSELIMVGVADPGGEHRTATGDAALEIARASETPVLAVPAGYPLLPKNALVAMDFSSASVRAGRAAIPLLAQGAGLTLAYVEPDVDFALLGDARLAETHANGIARLFEELRASLAVPGDVSVATVFLRGADPAAILLDYARAGDFDLIATGSQGEGAVDRHMTGSVSTALLRGARGAVLIAPAP